MVERCEFYMFMSKLIVHALTTFNQHDEYILYRIARAYEDWGTIEVLSPASLDGSNLTEETKQFSFDAVFSEHATQRKVYDTCAAPVVQSVLEGYNGTIFAYGQTGAGKASNAINL